MAVSNRFSLWQINHRLFRWLDEVKRQTQSASQAKDPNGKRRSTLGKRRKH